MKNLARCAFLAASMTSVLGGCNSEALLTSGMFQADLMSANDGTTNSVTAPHLLANVSRESETVVFTLPDGATTKVDIKALSEDEWGGGCATMMGSHVVQEVVRLTPGPITLADLTFSQPVLETQCNSVTLELHEYGAFDETKWILFRQAQ